MTDVWTSAGVIVGVAAVAVTGWERLDALVALAVAVNVVVAGQHPRPPLRGRPDGPRARRARAPAADDLIVAADNPKSLYDPSRLEPIASAKDFITENINVARRFVADRLSHPDIQRELDAIERGHGAIVDVDGDKVAAYRDDSGELQLLSPACRHMGCLVTWNPAERSWDCSCHGSRYATDGTVLEGPSVEPLERLG